MVANNTPHSPAKVNILPADPMGGGLAIIDVEKADKAKKEDTLSGPLGETTRKPYENEG